MFKKNQNEEKKDVEVVEFSQEGVRFSIPKRISVKQQQLYSGVVTALNQEEWIIRRWEGAKKLIVDWECELLPDINTDLDTVYDVGILDVTQWVGIKTMHHMNSLGEVEKN